MLPALVSFDGNDPLVRMHDHLVVVSPSTLWDRSEALRRDQALAEMLAATRLAPVLLLSAMADPGSAGGPGPDFPWPARLADRSEAIAAAQRAEAPPVVRPAGAGARAQQREDRRRRRKQSKRRGF